MAKGVYLARRVNLNVSPLKCTITQLCENYAFIRKMSTSWADDPMKSITSHLPIISFLSSYAIDFDAINSL